MKTPGANVARKLLNKAPCHTERQPVRAKPHAPPVLSPPHQIAELPVHPPVGAGDQSLDFSLLHTVKNVYGQIKVRRIDSNDERSYI